MPKRKLILAPLLHQPRIVGRLRIVEDVVAATDAAGQRLISARPLSLVTGAPFCTSWCTPGRPQRRKSYSSLPNGAWRSR